MIVIIVNGKFSGLFWVNDLSESWRPFKLDDNVTKFYSSDNFKGNELEKKLHERGNTERNDL